MSNFQHLIDRLNDANGIIDRLSAQEDDEFVRLNLLSIRRHRDEVKAEIESYLSEQHRSFFVYRLFRSGEQKYPAKAVGGALEAFQDLLTAVYDALINGPKKRFRPSFTSVQDTMLEFGGATSGSVKIFLAADEERLLVDQTNLQRALSLVDRTLSAQDTDDLTNLAEIVGVASISKAYDWAQHAVENGFTTELSWGYDLSGRNAIQISSDDAERVRMLIAERSDEETLPVDEIGILHGFDKESSYFHFVPLGTKEHIKGDVSSTMPQKVLTGIVYRAKLAQTIVTVFSTGEEKVRWMLLSLEEQGPVGEDLTLPPSS